MRPVRIALLALAGVVAALLLGSVGWSNPDEPALGVLRTSPDSSAEPYSSVSVVFDRPVAGGLDETVDAAAVFRIEPAVPGRAEWRDPVTLRFTPEAPLRPGATYRVSVANSFTAMDGSRLPSPLRFSFRVEGARVLVGDPVGPHSEPRFLGPEPSFRVLLSSAVEPRTLTEHAHLELAAGCGAPGTVRLRLAAQRPIGEDDPDWFRYYGAAGNDPERDLRRVVELVPARPLPPACGGELVMPERLDEPRGAQLRWRFSTYGPLRLLHAGCRQHGDCHYGPAEVVFSTPVRGADVLRHVRLSPGSSFTVRDTAELSDRWILEGRLQPRQRHTLTIGGALTDAFEQRLGSDTTLAFSTPGVPPSVIYPFGKLIVEREGFRTLAVQHVNVDTLSVAVAAVPDSLEARFLSGGWGGWGETWRRLSATATRSRIGVQNAQDRSSVSGIRLPTPDARGARKGTLLAVMVTGAGVRVDSEGRLPIALVQVTDLAVHARIGVDQGMVWVTSVRDGLPRAGAEVALHDAQGRVRASARTDAQGIARLQGFRAASPSPENAGCEECEPSFEGYVAATLGADRALVGINAYDPDLSPYQFGVHSAWGEERAPAAGAVFTERGIYRPGEPVHAKAIVRHGPLGSLAAPAPGDSVRWRFLNREGGVLFDTVAALSRFGTATHTLRLSLDAPLGNYGLNLQLHREGRWRTIGWTEYQVAEYRPPEFLVEVVTGSEPRLAGQTVRATVGGRYLFGAPMSRAPVRWSARQRTASPWEINIPGTEGYQIGDMGGWDDYHGEGMEVLASGIDTLDARGYRELQVELTAPSQGRPAHLTIEASVADANRQTVTAATTVLVHPAEFYLAARTEGSGYFWSAGSPVRLGVIAVRPDGGNVPGVQVQGTVVRREWHRVRRQRGGSGFEEVGEWVSRTVATCRLATAAQPAACGFTPDGGGAYTVTLTATDAQGRTATTRFTRWAVGGDFVPWNDEGKFRMDVLPDRQRYSVGDTATVLLAAPFTDAEAWVTVERERVIEQRRIRITSGTTTLKLPITEAYAPNAYVSVVVVRGRSAPPGTVDDPGRPTLRVGYAELRVTPESKRLTVEVRPLRPEYRPGDTARIQVRVRDAAGRGQQSEVTLWAVDEGVLSLTAYRTPDPLDLLYRPRGLGMRLASNLVSVAPQVPEGQKGTRHPGGGGGQDLAGVLRSRFRPTAFFLGSVVTDANGEAVAVGALPDNVTTFRVMAVAVTTGDRFGHGESPLLATRPLIARPALPRFLREGDDFTAGVVVNHRFGADLEARVTAHASGVTLVGRANQSLALRAGRGAEARFHFRAPAGDSATFRFEVTGGREADAVQLRVPVRPANRPVTHTVAGVLRDTATVEFLLPAEIDPARSRLELGFGTSPLALVARYQRQLEVYPYACTEQISSQALPLIALYAAERAGGAKVLPDDARARIENVVRTLSRRQRSDGGIGLWSATGWTSPWATAYAGRVLLEARAAGIAVDDAVLDRMAEYLARSLREPEVVRVALAGRDAELAASLAERMAAVEFLSRRGRPEVPAENQLLGQAARLWWEDRVALAEVLARRGAAEPARQLLDAAWQGVRVEGTRAVLPDAAYRRDFYFASHVRPAARLLTATLAIQPDHPGIGPLVETLVQQGRAEASSAWTTQDYGAAVLALVRFEQSQRGAAERTVRLRHGNRVLLETRARRGEPVASTSSLDGLLPAPARGTQRLRLSLDAAGPGAPVYFHVAVVEIASRPSFTPLDRGIVVERWYETLDTRRPVNQVEEGQVVRVRLRVTVPEQRNMVILDDPLPAGLEAVDLTLRTVSPFAVDPFGAPEEERETPGYGWYFGSWDSGMWSPFDHKEIRDDRVVYFARTLWKGTYSATYLARATTAGRFTAAPAHAEEMYNPGVHGRSGGGGFVVNGAAR